MLSSLFNTSINHTKYSSLIHLECNVGTMNFYDTMSVRFFKNIIGLRMQLLHDLNISCWTASIVTLSNNHLKYFKACEIRKDNFDYERIWSENAKWNIYIGHADFSNAVDLWPNSRKHRSKTLFCFNFNLHQSI